MRPVRRRVGPDVAERAAPTRTESSTPPAARLVAASKIRIPQHDSMIKLPSLLITHQTQYCKIPCKSQYRIVGEKHVCMYVCMYEHVKSFI